MITYKEMELHRDDAYERYKVSGKSVWDKIVILIDKITPLLFKGDGTIIKLNIWNLGRLIKIVGAVISFIKSL